MIILDSFLSCYFWLSNLFRQTCCIYKYILYTYVWIVVGSPLLCILSSSSSRRRRWCLKIPGSHSYNIIDLRHRDTLRKRKLFRFQNTVTTFNFNSKWLPATLFKLYYHLISIAKRNLYEIFYQSAPLPSIPYFYHIHIKPYISKNPKRKLEKKKSRRFLSFFFLFWQQIILAFRLKRV